MTITRRPLAGPDTLGERLGQLRREKKLSVEELGERIQVATKYIEAIEESRYRDIPGLVYARNFVRLYVRAMQLPVESAMERFEEEWQVIQGRRTEPARMVARAKTEPQWWQKHAGLLVAGIIVAGLISYLGWQVLHFFQPPKLVLTQPAVDLSTGSSSLLFVGETEPEVAVTINGQTVEIDEQGKFEETVDLQPGLNVLKVAAKRKRSQEASIIRRVLYERPEVGTGQ